MKELGLVYSRSVFSLIYTVILLCKLRIHICHAIEKYHWEMRAHQILNSPGETFATDRMLRFLSVWHNFLFLIVRQRSIASNQLCISFYSSFVACNPLSHSQINWNYQYRKLLISINDHPTIVLELVLLQTHNEKHFLLIIVQSSTDDRSKCILALMPAPLALVISLRTVTSDQTKYTIIRRFLFELISVISLDRNYYKEVINLLFVLPGLYLNILKTEKISWDYHSSVRG